MKYESTHAVGEHTPSWLLLSEILDYDYDQKTLKAAVMREEEYHRYRQHPDDPNCT